MKRILKYFKNKTNNYEFVRNQHGVHQIGGEVPANFNIPNNEFPAGFQYLGFIDNKDPLFSWLPFKINFIYPIYSDEKFIFLDYKNPDSPAIIEPENTATSTTIFDGIDQHSKIIFEETKVSVEDVVSIDKFDSIGNCIVPQWSNDIEIPACPLCGKSMKFLCQLGSFSNIEVFFNNVNVKEEMQEYFEKLNFWGNGSLDIFIEPSSKIMCYTIQND